jgi:hypothetical protein
MGCRYFRMQRLFPSYRVLTAVLSLIAVVLAVLEHEDLIFQAVNGDIASEKTAMGNSLPVLTDLANSTLESESRDSGTEGEFRSEAHRLRAALGGCPLPAPCWRGRVVAHRPAYREARLIPPTCPRIVGTVELRI